MEKRQIRDDGPAMTAIGLGCMGMSEFYGPSDDQRSIGVIHHALERGVTVLDTADMYGTGHNEQLIGKALAGGWRDRAFLCTKFAVKRGEGGSWEGVSGDPKYVREACEASLKRLGVEEAMEAHLAPRPPRPGASLGVMTRNLIAATLLLSLAAAPGCGGASVDRESTLSGLREAMTREIPEDDPEVLEDHNQLVEDARDGNVFDGMRRSQVQDELGRGQECGTRPICARGGFEPDDWVYEIGRRDGLPWGPTMIVGFDRQGIVNNVYTLTRR